ncbi:MAG: DNA primase, partial [Candidatus Paceibacterota bacterium]
GEKTPSFFVSPSRGTYHCFGCSRGGDIFTFVEEIEGVQFQDALKLLADKAGVELRNVDPKAKSEYDKLYGLIESAVAYYEECLRENNEALLYLKNRGLTDATIKSWRIGFAKDSWSGLYDTLKKKGYGDADIDKAGFIISGNRGYYDRFRSRIMFPLSGANGKIVGFSGRIFLPYDKEKEKELAKYVNSPDTVLYNKSRILYGYDKAKTSMMRENTTVLVEGQMDLLMSHQAGVTNTVALSGTALTEDHLRMIKRFSDNLVLALDSDAAGFAASERAWRLAISLGLDVKAAKLPKGSDPALAALKDPEGFKTSIKEAKHIIEYLLEGIKEKDLDKRAFLLEVGKRVLPYVAEVGNKIDQAHFVGKIAGEIGVEEKHLWEEIDKLKRKIVSVTPAAVVEKQPSFFRKDVIARKILGIILWQEGEVAAKKEAKVDISLARAKYTLLAEEYGLARFEDMKDTKDLIFESELYYTGHEHLNRELAELERNLEREILEELFTEAMRELAESEKRNEIPRAEELLKKCQDISRKINEIKNRIT